MIRQFLVNPKLDYNTFGNSKAKRKFLVFLYKNYYGGRIPYSIPQLEINAHLVSTFHTSNNIIQSVGINSSVGDIHSRLVTYLVRYLLKYFNLKRAVERGSIAPKFSVFGMSPFWINNKNQLCIRKKYIRLLTSDEKRVISSIYGEAIVRLILENSPELPSAGVLKINSGKESTPDFIVLTRELRIAMVAEVKSSIDKNKGNTERQKRNFIRRYPKEKLRGIGVNVKLNYKSDQEKAIDMEVQDPEYTVDGNIVLSLIWRLALIESLIKVQKHIIFEVNDMQWAENLLQEYKKNILGNDFTLKDITKHKISHNKLNFKNQAFNNIVLKILNPPKKLGENKEINETIEGKIQKTKENVRRRLIESNERKIGSRKPLNEQKILEPIFKSQLEYISGQSLFDGINIKKL